MNIDAEDMAVKKTGIFRLKDLLISEYADTQERLARSQVEFLHLEGGLRALGAVLDGVERIIKEDTPS